jgi:hypothetical protein
VVFRHPSPIHLDVSSHAPLSAFSLTSSTTCGFANRLKSSHASLISSRRSGIEGNRFVLSQHHIGVDIHSVEIPKWRHKERSSKSEVISELFWASVHGIAELTRTKRFPRSRQKERVRALVELFNFPRDETAQVVKAR